MTYLKGEETSQLHVHRNSTINTPHRQSKICFVFNTKFSKMTISHVYTSQFSQIFLLVWWRWHLFQSSFGLTDHTYRSTVKSLSSPGFFSQMDSYPIWVYRSRHLRVHHLLYAIWKVQNLCGLFSYFQNLTFRPRVSETWPHNTFGSDSKSFQSVRVLWLSCQIEYSKSQSMSLNFLMLDMQAKHFPTMHLLLPYHWYHGTGQRVLSP